ncbi:hypothetical protein C5B91_18060 [Haloferax sp. Atlit-10N]|nr:hypothetical protein C5B87_09555 [Haloferax sp. Atlit-16N]RDZ56263.1 hypothetical protein C5B91_18060 [Haloferax sp. Atlit-10N]
MMFGFREDRRGSTDNKRSAHDKANLDRISELERNPLTEVVAADHTNQYPDPDSTGGHIPDYEYRDRLTGELIRGETEKCGDRSAHARSQRRAFESAGPFELNEFGCDRGFDLGFDETSTHDKTSNRGLFDLF